MANDCIIGLLHQYEDSQLVTIEDLKEHIAESKYHNEVLVPLYAQSDPQRLMRKIWTLADYGDLRKSTNLTRFAYCPKCRKEIDWKAIRGMQDGK
jgi:hypothetical protein